MLTIKNLTKTVKQKNILENINIEIQDGSFISLLGPSGSGKTTLLRIIMGLENCHCGEVTYEKKLLTQGKKIIVPAAQRKFSLVFQEFTLFPHFNVYQNIVAGMDHITRSDRRKIAGELLDLFEISHLKQRSIDTLSGGEQQRAAIVSALAVRPKLLMLDEPFSNIDRRMKEELYIRLQKVLKDYRMTTILATHDHGEAFFFSDRIYILKDGRIKDSRPPYPLYTTPADPWVASFIGDVNYLTGYELKHFFQVEGDSISEDSYYLVRPEEFCLSSFPQTAGAGTRCTVEKGEFYGFYSVVTVMMENGKKIKIKNLDRKQYREGDIVSLDIIKNIDCILSNKFDVKNFDQVKEGNSEDIT
jgi:iron(III) transport system ATP-binding protein